MQRLAWLLPFCIATVGCGPAVGIDTGTEADESSGSDPGTTTDTIPSGSSGPDSTTTTTPPGTTTTPPTATDPTIGPDSSTTDPTTGFGSSSSGGDSSAGSSGSTDDSGGLPDGASCSADPECASGHCYLAGVLGGVCGECSNDADCDFGCNAPNPLANPPEGSTCGTGNLGENCEDETACVGLQCVPVIEVPELIEISSCSECGADADCMPGLICDVDISVEDFDGFWACTAPGTEPLGSSCDLEGSGDDACNSGHCASAPFIGLLELGVCSQCEVNEDCSEGQTCAAPEVSPDGTVTAGFCS